ncbi:hypothetical protein ES703_107645 [subsurface metagenome]
MSLFQEIPGDIDIPAIPEVEQLVMAANKLHWNILEYMRDAYGLKDDNIPGAWLRLSKVQQAEVQLEIKERLASL